jgi:predicted metal-dependent phosphoesterase TrpH
MDCADLHTHSHYSDGEWPPAKVVRAAAHAGLAAVSITDHDDIRATAEAVAAGEEHGVEVLSGVELSTWWEEQDLHVLGYGFDPDHGELRALLARARDGRRQRAAEMAERLGALGVPVAWEKVEEIAADGAIGRPHLARALVAAGHVPHVRAAFDLYLGDDKPACVEKMRLLPEDAVDLIHAAGGVAIVAHPVVLGGIEALERLLPTGVDGIEVCHRLHGRNAERGFDDFARDHQLLRTGGSDFHGPRLGGVSVGDVTIPREWWDELMNGVANRRAESASNPRRRERFGG